LKSGKTFVDYQWFINLRALILTKIR